MSLMPNALQGSWPEADFIASSEAQGGPSRTAHPGAAIPPSMEANRPPIALK